MRKFYVSIVVCLFCTLKLSAQQHFWVGPSGGNWNNIANWSGTAGGAGGFGVPNGVTEDAVFTSNALVNVDNPGIALNRLIVTNSATAKLYITAPLASSATITLLSTSAVNPALQIDAGARLEDSADVNFGFTTSFGNNAKGLVNGTWYFSGSAAVTGGNGATFDLPTTSGLTNRVDVNGSIIFRNNTFTDNNAEWQNYLFFNNGSTYQLDRNGGSVPAATWNANATISITGVTTIAPTINVGTLASIGNLVFNSPNVTANISPMVWGLPNNLDINGNLEVLNTNGRVLALASNGNAGLNNLSYNVDGNFNISGTSNVAIASASNANKVVTFQVNGNFNPGGTSFDIQVSNNVVANPTTLLVKGNINHSAGTFGASSNSTNAAVDLFILELNGTSNQNISSVTGSFDNANNQVTLRMNNAAGATLTTPLAVGKIDFNTASDGRLTTTTTNVLTINNTAATSIVVNGPSNAGFVNGPVRRRTAASGSAYLLPTGKGTVYHGVEIFTSSATLSTYQGEYFNASFGDLTVLPPLTGVSNTEYWQVSTVSGANAAVQLSLNGTAVPGAQATDGVAVARYNGADWVYSSGNGTIITPGNATTGSTRSGTLVLNNFFTFGFGPLGSLPIQLLTFDAKKISSTAALINWEITGNSTPSRFEVLKSADGRNFGVAGSVPASGQAAYAFTDNNLPKGITYYRLKMFDIDGTAKLSKVVAVINGGNGILITAILPSVVTSNARLAVTSSERGAMQVSITDMYGRLVSQQQLSIGTGNQEIPLNLYNLAKGAYQLTGYMNGERVGTIRFIKQ